MAAASLTENWRTGSRMDTVALPVAMVAPPVGLLNCTLKVSLPSSTGSSWVASRTRRDVWPGAKVTVPD
jgi:hypothetical protein